MFSKLGCPVKVITDNAQVFSASKFVGFHQKSNAMLSHSTVIIHKEMDWLNPLTKL